MNSFNHWRMSRTFSAHCQKWLKARLLWTNDKINQLIIPNLEINCHIESSWSFLIYLQLTEKKNRKILNCLLFYMAEFIWSLFWKQFNVCFRACACMRGRERENSLLHTLLELSPKNIKCYILCTMISFQLLVCLFVDVFFYSMGGWICWWHWQQNCVFE